MREPAGRLRVGMRTLHFFPSPPPDEDQGLDTECNLGNSNSPSLTHTLSCFLLMLAQFHASWGFPMWTKLRDRLRGWASKHMVPGN